MTVPITVTERAAHKIGEILRQEPVGTMLRVSVEGGGCSGFQYKFDTERSQGRRRRRDRAQRRHGADRSGLAQLHGRRRDRFRRRSDRLGLQDQQSAGHRLLRLRHELRASSTVRIATWNVNSIKQRLDAAVAWLAERQPDIVCLQETKCVDDAFPREPFEAARLQRRRPRPKGVQRRRAAVEISVRRGEQRPARRPRRRPCAFHRSGGLDGERARCASRASICPTAIRRRRKNTPTRWRG